MPRYLLSQYKVYYLWVVFRIQAAARTDKKEEIESALEALRTEAMFIGQAMYGGGGGGGRGHDDTTSSPGNGGAAEGGVYDAEFSDAKE